MQTKYSEKALLKVCFAMTGIIVSAIACIAYCVGKVLDDIT